MGLLGFFFGKEKQAKRYKTKIVSKIFTIDEIGFTGLFSRSPNKEWIIAVCDGYVDTKGFRGGHRSSGQGSYLLYHVPSEEVVQLGHVNRPNNPKVANNGTFTVEDWGVANDLSGTFLVFTSSGEKILDREFSANLYSNGISDNGVYAAAQTANSGTEDGGKLVGFDLRTGEELFSVTPKGGKSLDFTFNELDGTFGTILKGMGMFYYSKSGDFLDDKRLSDRLINGKDHHRLLSEAARLLEEGELRKEKLTKIADRLRKGLLTDLVAKNAKLKAQTLKVLGLYCEKLNLKEEALLSYEEALEIDPKIGLRRRAEKLKKKE